MICVQCKERSASLIFHSNSFCSRCFFHRFTADIQSSTGQPCIYLAGPMTGIEEHNRPAFNHAASDLRFKGYEVINPAENFKGDVTLPYEKYMQLSTVQVAMCDEVWFLDGWEESRGANYEMFLAIMMDKKVKLYPNMVELEKKIHMSVFKILGLKPYKVNASENQPRSILTKAEGLVHGDRNQSYGSPVEDFTRTVGMINSLFAHKLNQPLTAEDFARIMVCCKLSRSVHTYRQDNYVDGAGYFECADWCARDGGQEPASQRVAGADPVRRG